MHGRQRIEDPDCKELASVEILWIVLDRTHQFRLGVAVPAAGAPVLHGVVGVLDVRAHDSTIRAFWALGLRDLLVAAAKVLSMHVAHLERDKDRSKRVL